MSKAAQSCWERWNARSPLALGLRRPQVMGFWGRKEKEGGRSLIMEHWVLNVGEE